MGCAASGEGERRPRRPRVTHSPAPAPPPPPPFPASGPAEEAAARMRGRGVLPPSAAAGVRLTPPRLRPGRRENVTTGRRGRWARLGFERPLASLPVQPRRRGRRKEGEKESARVMPERPAPQRHPAAPRGQRASARKAGWKRLGGGRGKGGDAPRPRPLRRCPQSTKKKPAFTNGFQPTPMT